MVDSVKRKLRDGVIDGEQAPIVLVRDSVSSHSAITLLKDVLLGSICGYVSKSLAQAKVVVVVAISEPPECYDKVAARAGSNQDKRFRIVDCYTDRLGWEGKGGTQSFNDPPAGGPNVFSVYRDIRNLDSLQSIILEAGREGTPATQASDQFVVFFDSISSLLRYHSLQALASFLSALRSHSETSALACLLHSDLHVPQVTSALEYLSSTTIAVEPYSKQYPKTEVSSESEHGDSLKNGIVRIRQKRRNGRVREQTEMFSLGRKGFTFGPLKYEPIESRTGKLSVPKVQFNLSLSEKEIEDRSKVVLPFEHQGNGQERRIYDGRENSKAFDFISRSQDGTSVQDADSGTQSDSGLGAIHYLRDSDDERPDSDEDPDDDLDI